MRALLKVRNLSKVFKTGFLRRGTLITAVNNVTFELNKGEILSLIGESGSGKTTTAKLILKLLRPTSGEIYLEDVEIWSIPNKNYWRRVQAVFQDPYASFNPIYKVNRVLKNAFKLIGRNLSKSEVKGRIKEVLTYVGLKPDEVLDKRPFELSGGQLQRVLLARCLLIDPQIIIADEPTSMIDASTRVEVLNIFKKLSKEGKSIIFITHDISQAFYVSDTMLVMHKGAIVERGRPEDIVFSPKHPYTKGLISAVPKLHERFGFS